jgi:hypothetical protein
MVQRAAISINDNLRIKLNSGSAISNKEVNCWILSKMSSNDYAAVDRLIRRTIKRIEIHSLDLVSTILDATRLVPSKIPSRANLLKAMELAR